MVRLTDHTPCVPYHGAMHTSTFRALVTWASLRFLVLALFMSCVALVPAARVIARQDAPAQAPADQSQFWVGTVELPGMALEFTASLSASAGTMSIPMQGAANVPLRDVSVGAGEMRFTLAGPNAPEATWAIFEMKPADDGSTAEGTLRQAGQTFPVKMRRGTPGEAAAKPAMPQAAAPVRPQTPTGPFPYQSREVTFQGATPDITLAGTLTIPEGTGPHPAVILLTGSGSQDRDETLLGHKPFAIIADALTRRGVAVLRCDDRGVGGSTGSMLETTTEDAGLDALKGIEFLAGIPEVDAGRVGLIGHSEGAIAAGIAAARSDRVRFIALLAGPVLPGREILRMQSAALLRAEASVSDEAVLEMLSAHDQAMDLLLADADPSDLMEAIEELAGAQMRAAGAQIPNQDQLEALAQQQSVMLRSKWFRYFAGYDPAESLSQVRVPILAMIGEFDQQVPARENLGALRAILEGSAHEDHVLTLLPGLNHLFQPAKTGGMTEYATIEQSFSPAALELLALWVTRRAGIDPAR